MDCSLVNKSLLWVAIVLVLHTYRSKCCIEKERVSLLKIKKQFNSMSYPNQNIFPSWSGDDKEDCCLWERVKCDPSTGQVTELSLHSSLGSDPNYWTGYTTVQTWSLDMSVFWHLEQLQSLDLSDNFIGVLDESEALYKIRKLQVLNLRRNQLKGVLSKSIGNLSSLCELDLSHNQFTGSVPSGLCKLKKLQLLDLSWNEFSDSLPKCFEKLTTLRELHLSNNKFEGSISSMFSNLTSLEKLSISHNFFEGKFSLSSLSNHSILKELDLSETHSLQIETEDSFWIPSFQLQYLDLSGCILNNETKAFPKFLSHQHNLEHLHLSDNGLVGSFPTSLLQNYSKLEALILSNNLFTGSLQFPDNHNSASFLSILDLSRNSFSGVLPRQLFNLTQLQMLLLSENQFNGSIEDPHLNSSNIVVLRIANNNLSGELPRWIRRLEQLQVLSMSGNQLDGRIPSALCNLTSLFYLDLSKNRFIDQMPSCYGLSNLKHLHLHSNSLTGYLPDALLSSSNLVTLYLHDNQLSGGIPSWIDQLSNLEILILRNNWLQGELPTQLCSLRQLSVLDASNNRVVGTIPPCFGSMTFRSVKDSEFGEVQLTVEGRSRTYLMHTAGLLDLSFNQLTGSIPLELGQLNGIYSLNLSHNHLTGLIPSTLSKMQNLECLDLSYNNLSGTIPSQLTDLHFLEVFNVSYNNLSGRPPMTAQFASFDESTYGGNPLLCGYLVGRSCVVAEPPLAPFQEDVRGAHGRKTEFDRKVFFWSFVLFYITV